MGAWVLMGFAAAALCRAAEGEPMNLVFACKGDNDLYRVVSAAAPGVARFDTAAEAVRQAREGAGVLVLADGYPNATTAVDQALFDAAAAKRLRLYVEYPSYLPGLEVGEPRAVQWERAVASSDAFGPALEPLRILAIHDCRFLPVAAANPQIVLARVAGFDTAAYGLPDDVFPILFEHPNAPVLVATTKLSQFVTARYAPMDAWKAIGNMILRWLVGGGGTRSDARVPDLTWTPTVRPSFGPKDELPSDVESQAFRRGAQWFFNAKLFPAEAQNGREGDGGCGMFEGFSAAIRSDGSQAQSRTLRNDCMGEGAMALAFDGVLNRDERSKATAGRLPDYIYLESALTKGPRGDPQSPSFGLVGWDNNTSQGVYYGDDNARSLLGTLACAALQKSDRWDERMMRCLLANLRTTGTLGFREARLDEAPLHENGWRHYFTTPTIFYAPHYEAYLWACFLWAHNQTGFSPFLERPRNALRMMIEAYPNDWQWTNGFQQERARLLLPLAWLVRIEDTPEHRQWLRRIAEDLVAAQDVSGAIREELGPPGKGAYGPPKSNAEYGTNEATLIQQNGDPLSDLLYTTNFAFLGLHEAAKATGDTFYADAEDKLAKFLCRIQIRSERHPELDGGWFRAFDFRRWEYWGSSADLGWGAWSIESGWTCGWINAVLAMRRMNTSLWDLTADSAIESHFDGLRKLILPEPPPEK